MESRHELVSLWDLESRPLLVKFPSKWKSFLGSCQNHDDGGLGVRLGQRDWKSMEWIKMTVKGNEFSDSDNESDVGDMLCMFCFDISSLFFEKTND